MHGGETEPYYVSTNPLVWKEGKAAGYAWSSYNWCNGSSNSLTKYNVNETYGLVDNIQDFKDYNYEDDAARQYLGGVWRMPTYEEWLELLNNYTWIWSSQNGVNGQLAISNINGGKVFFPAAGQWNNEGLVKTGTHCYYWSSSLSEEYPFSAHNFAGSQGILGRNGSNGRYTGQSIRPVLAE